METTGLLDNRNIDLWKELNAFHEIILQENEFPYYSLFSQQRSTLIYIPSGDINPASFTHELLHIYLRTKEVYIGGGLTNSIKSSPILIKFCSDGLIEHIGNCLEHIKILPEFIKLGYKESEFLFDYAVNKLTDGEIQRIKASFSTGSSMTKMYNGRTIDFFIGKYFSAISCPNRIIDYSKNLLELKQIDNDLFSILESLRIAWDNFDYNSDDILVNSYHTCVFDFTDNLEKWALNKVII